MISQALIDVSVALIVSGHRTFAQVPNTIKPAVEAALAAIGLGTDGQPLKTAV